MENLAAQGKQSSIRRLYRSTSDRWIAGVSAGLAEYFNVPVYLSRTVMAGLVLSGIGVIAYILMWIIVPSNPEISENTAAPATEVSTTVYRIVGGGLILLGVYELLENMHIFILSDWYDYISEYAFPIFLILLGVAIIYFSVNHINSGGNTMSAQSTEPKRLYRVMKERMIAGVCAGLGYYFNIDPVLVRILFIISIFASFGATLFVYLVLALVTPKDIE